jgi:hypothetical protein
MIRYFAVILFAVSAASLAACHQSSDSTETLRDKQIVCSLTGEAFIFIDDAESVDRSIRSEESDPLCQPMKAFIKMKPDSGARQ